MSDQQEKPSERLMKNLAAYGAPDLNSEEARAALVQLAVYAAQQLGETNDDPEIARFAAEVDAAHLAKQVQASRASGVPYTMALDLVADVRYRRWRERDEMDRAVMLENQQRGIAAEERIATALERLVALLEAK